jgi:NIPSNAP
MRYQLRIYGVLPGRAEDFAREWREQVVPLRRAHGFGVVGGWIEEGGDRFVWIVGHEDFEAADRAYYESPERAAMEPDPARHLDTNRIETCFLQTALPD